MTNGQPAGGAYGESNIPPAEDSQKSDKDKKVAEKEVVIIEEGEEKTVGEAKGFVSGGGTDKTDKSKPSKPKPETKSFWQRKGYSEKEASQIASYASRKKRTPSPDKIEEITKQRTDQQQPQFGDQLTTEEKVQRGRDKFEQLRQESIREFTREKGIPQPETPEQRETIQRLMEQEQLEKGGLTREERKKGIFGARKVEEVGQREEVKETLSKIKKQEQSLEETMKRIRSASDKAMFETAQGNTLSKQQALERLGKQLKETRSARSRAETQLGKEKKQIGILEDLRKTTEKKIGSGKTAEFVFEKLSPVQKTILGAKTAFSPRAFELVASNVLPDKTPEQVLKEEFKGVRRAQERGGVSGAVKRGAIRSLGSPTGTAGLGLAGGAVYGAATTGVSAASPTAGALGKAGAGAIGTTLALRQGRGIYEDIQEGEFTEATGKGLRFGLGALAFTAGAKAMQPTVQKTQVQKSDVTLRGVKGTQKAVRSGSLGKAGTARIKQTLKVPRLLRGPKKATRFIELKFSDIQAGPKTSYAAGKAFVTSPKGRLIGTKDFVTSSLKTGQQFKSIVTPKGQLSVSGKPLQQFTTKTEFAGQDQVFGTAYTAQTGKITKPGIGQTILTKGFSTTGGAKSFTSGKLTVLEPQSVKISKTGKSFRGLSSSISKTVSAQGATITKQVSVSPALVSNIRGMSAGQLGATTKATTSGLTKVAFPQVEGTQAEADLEQAKTTDYPGGRGKITQQTEEDVDEVTLKTSAVEETEVTEEATVTETGVGEKEKEEEKISPRTRSTSDLVGKSRQEQFDKLRQFGKQTTKIGIKPMEGTAFAETSIEAVRTKLRQKQLLKTKQEQIGFQVQAPVDISVGAGIGAPGLIDQDVSLKPKLRTGKKRKVETERVPGFPKLDVLSAGYAQRAGFEPTTPVSKKARRQFARPETTIKGFKSVEERTGKFEVKPFGTTKRKEVNFV